MSRGRTLDREAPTQQAIIDLLEASPLPWTLRMLRDWFLPIDARSSIRAAAWKLRIWRIERNLYTSNKHYAPHKPPRPKPSTQPKIIVTDDMCWRNGWMTW